MQLLLVEDVVLDGRLDTHRLHGFNSDSGSHSYKTGKINHCSRILPHIEESLTSQIRVWTPALPIPPTLGNLPQSACNRAEKDVNTDRISNTSSLSDQKAHPSRTP